MNMQFSFVLSLALIIFINIHSAQQLPLDLSLDIDELYSAQNEKEKLVDDIILIEEFWSGRYHLATEATWQILGYNITKKTPSVTPLPIHLPNSFHHQRYTTKGGAGSISSLERYFLCLDGTFQFNGILSSRSPLKIRIRYATNVHCCHFICSHIVLVYNYWIHDIHQCYIFKCDISGIPRSLCNYIY